MKKISFLFIGFCLFTNLSAQKVYRLDASNVMETPLYGHLKMGNPGPKERAIEVNSLYPIYDRGREANSTRYGRIAFFTYP